MPLPAQPPVAHEAEADIVEENLDKGVGPSLRPSTAASVVSTARAAEALGTRPSSSAGPSVRFASFAGSAAAPASAEPRRVSFADRTVAFVPDSVITSPRYVSEKTAELRARPTAAERTGLTRFRVPAAAKTQIQRAILANTGSMSSVLHHE